MDERIRIEDIIKSDAEIPASPRNVTVSTTVLKAKSQPCSDFEVLFIDLNQLHHDNDRQFKKITDSSGNVTFNMLQGIYKMIVQSDDGKIISEALQLILKDEHLIVNLPIWLETRTFQTKVAANEMEKFYSKYRKDNFYCDFCQKKYVYYFKRFRCAYCSFFFCGEHREPEEHKCKKKRGW